MKVLGINASPRAGGNTDMLLEQVFAGARENGAETEKIILGKLKFSPCLECADMKDDGSCIVRDEMQSVYEKIKSADALVFASPIFFGSLSAQAKMMIDRFQCVWRAKYITKQKAGYKKINGVFISVEGSDRDDFFENAKAIVKNFFAVIDVRYKGELFCSGVDAKGAMSKRQDYLRKAFELGGRIAKGE